ncbi:MAG: hypothetical protein KF814_05025 [Nitrospiraceae bacterium]|nr:hypothetical protein [Nitrospiraceae bacterium]
MANPSQSKLAVCAVLALGLGGCAVIETNTGSSAVLPSSAYFSVDQADLRVLQGIAHAQEQRLKNCSKGLACEDAYYTRGLVALFENRADAITVFQELHTTMPQSRFDAAVVGWLNLLQDTTPATKQNTALHAQLKQEVLHNLLERQELALARGIKTQDRKVAELSR